MYAVRAFHDLMPRPPQFHLRTALACVRAVATLLALLRADLPIGFAIAAMFIGPSLSFRGLALPTRLWKAALAGSLGGALGGCFGGFVFGIKESWGGFSSYPEWALGQAGARAVGGATLGCVVGALLGLLMRMVFRHRQDPVDNTGVSAGRSNEAMQRTRLRRAADL